MQGILLTYSQGAVFQSLLCELFLEYFVQTAAVQLGLKLLFAADRGAASRPVQRSFFHRSQGALCGRRRSTGPGEAAIARRFTKSVKGLTWLELKGRLNCVGLGWLGLGPAARLW